MHLKQYNKISPLLWSALSVLTILSIIFFYFGCFILSSFMFVTTVFVGIGLNRFQYDKKDLKIHHHNIDTEILPAMFSLEIHHIIFAIISISIIYYFNILFGLCYLFFIIFGTIGSFIEWNIYNLVPNKTYQYYKNFKKDTQTISYHWSNDFLIFKIFNRITLLSLPLGITFLVFALPFYQENDTLLVLNLYHAGILCIINAIISFSIDTYIIFFSNTSVLNKFGYFCYRCALYGSGIIGCGNLMEHQLIHNSFDGINFRWQPTSFTNIPRIALNKPIYLDNDQYWHDHIIRKYLPHITYDQYTSKYNNIVSQIDSTKTNNIIKANWSSLAENCTKQELCRIRLGQGYLSDVQRR